MKLNSNALQYGLPPDLGFLDELSVLDVSNNGIESIPIELFGMGNIKTLSLASNRISGPLATEIGLVTSLVELDLSQNEISNKLPSEIGNLGALEVLDVSNNRMDGSVPLELSNLYSLKEIDLSYNNFFGVMDDSFCGLSLDTLRADCLQDGITLSCATECCDAKETCCGVDDIDCSFSDQLRGEKISTSATFDPIVDDADVDTTALKQLFDELDADKNGVIDFDELKRGLRRLNVLPRKLLADGQPE